ncbi:hypothetical protein ACB092_04G088100 [Castanea dentata]
MPQFHLCSLTPNTSQMIHSLVVDLNCFIKYNSGIDKITVLLIKPSKVNPQCMRFPQSFHRINCPHCLSVSQNLLLGITLKQLHPSMPLFHIMRTLLQPHTISQLRSPIYKIIQSSNPQIHILIIV